MAARRRKVWRSATPRRRTPWSKGQTFTIGNRVNNQFTVGSTTTATTSTLLLLGAGDFRPATPNPPQQDKIWLRQLLLQGRFKQSSTVAVSGETLSVYWWLVRCDSDDSSYMALNNLNPNVANYWSDDNVNDVRVLFGGKCELKWIITGNSTDAASFNEGWARCNVRVRTPFKGGNGLYLVVQSVLSAAATASTNLTFDARLQAKVYTP